MTLGLGPGQVRLHEDHEDWAKQYQVEKARLLQAVGSHILEIQHVGSTSVLGVPAKPIIDILVGVGDFEEAVVCIAPMEGIGYCYRGENGIPRRHYFVRGDPRTHHVHMVERGSENWRITLAFRDLLRSDDGAAREYSEAKKRLAAQYPDNREAYQREKDKIVARILEGVVS